MCWLDILLLTTYNAATTFITKGGCCLKVGARSYRTRIKHSCCLPEPKKEKSKRKKPSVSYF